MDDSSASAPWYWRSKPLGKVRRRVQDLRIPSPSCYDLIANRPALDLSHNESARLAVDSLLSRGLEGYHEVLNAEGEVDFLSQLEKIYILENGRDGNTADPGASDESDTDFDSLSTGSQSATQCPAVSTDSDPILAGLDLSSQKDVKQTDPALDKPDVEVYFQFDNRAASMKDLVREFIRNAGMALAIVMDSFSDVELLCDLLEASRKRNVSVYLLLDHLHLNLFVSMWQELKLNSKNFPKLSVHSVDGQTYCAKTGRKLTGQIAESFIISDWTEVLTGSYSFSWLSWQTHRGLAVLVKGSAVTPFHQEFLRLHSSSKPIPGFDTFITVPHTLPLYTTLHAAESTYNDPSKSKPSPTKTICPRAQKEDGQEDTQTKAKMPVLSNSQSAELECSKGKPQPLHRASAGTQMHEKPPQLCLKPLIQPGALQSVSVGEHTIGAVCTQLGAQTHVEFLEKNQPQIQSHSNPLSQPHVSNVQSHHFIATTAEKNARAQESNPLYTASPTYDQHRIVSYQPTFRINLEHHYVGTEGLFFHQRNRNRLTEHSGIAPGLDTQRRQWNYLLNFKPKADFLSANPKVLPPSTLQQKQAKTDLWLPLTHPRGHTSGLQTKVSSLGTRRQDHPQKHHQPSLQLHQTTEASGSKSASSALGAHLKPQLQSDSKLFLPGTGATQHLQPHTSQQARPPPRLNWMSQSRTERPRPVARLSSFSTNYGTGQQTDGQVGWRPFHSSMNTSVGRSQSTADRQLAGLNPNITKP
ncbi:protein FAM83A isoform X2 [Sander lucioperca]|uniref:protein FAM83A isoform X2 n=1 Tax=Sander lucioperca TaxID=283035 RepID=UPI0016534DD2|nr:protein FAM83A isoform X2 [Sander lucioperca]